MTSADKLSSALGIALIAVIFTVIASSVLQSGDASLIKLVDSQNDFTNEVQTSTNTVYTNGYLQFDSDGDTSASYTSVKYNYTEHNLTEVKVVTDDLTSNNSATVNITYYDSGTNQINSEEKTLTEGTTTVDISGESNAAEFEVKLDLSRDSGSDTSPRIDSYAYYDDYESVNFILKYVLYALVAAGVIFVINRAF